MSAAQQQLSDLFDADVRAQILDEQTQGDLRLTVCNVSYQARNHSSSTTSRSGLVQQTAVLMSADAFDFPKFQLLATGGSGPSRFILTKLLGVKGLSFPDSPRFAEQYLLFGMPEEPLRVLFHSEVREYFASHPGWSVRGDHRLLVIYREHEVCDAAKLDEFVVRASEILTQLSRAEQELDARPELNRQATVSDLANVRQQYGGLVGAAIERQLKKIVVSRQDLETFLASPVPRRPPAKLKRQVLGDTLPLVFAGFGLMVAGIVSAVVWYLVTAGDVRWLSVIPALLFPLIGITMATLTLRHRGRRARLLQQGQLVTGSVEEVQRTNTSVNNRVLHRVGLRFSDHRGTRTAHCTVDPMAAEKARRFRSEASRVQILVDPQDETNVYCVDLAVIDG